MVLETNRGDKMPYKNKEIQKRYEKEWRIEHSEDMKWEYILWVENNRERRNKLNKEYRERNKNYINALKRLKTKLYWVETK